MRATSQARFARLALTLCAALFVASATACGDDADDANGGGDRIVTGEHFIAEFEPMPDPPVVGDNIIHLTLMDADGTPVTEADIEVEPYMPGHGHGTPEVPEVSEEGDGQYTISNIHYTMPGHWEVRLDVTAGGVQEKLVADYDV